MFNLLCLRATPATSLMREKILKNLTLILIERCNVRNSTSRNRKNISDTFKWRYFLRKNAKLGSRDIWITLLSMKCCQAVNVSRIFCNMLVCYNSVSICKQIINCYINVLTPTVIFISVLGILPRSEGVHP